ncbi:MAG: sigma-70 family RNA polymerase sigma factor, partial [Planctomycetota bacterium]
MMHNRATHLNPDRLLENTSWMRPLALRLVGDVDDADDVVQDSWLVAVAEPSARIRTEPSRWLTGVLRRISAGVLRSRTVRARHERAVAEASPTHSDAAPGHDVENAEVGRVLLDEVRALDEPYRTAILQRYYDGLTPPEIAARSELPLATVKTRLRRGLSKLRPRVLGRLGDERGRSLAAFAVAASVSSVSAATTTSSTFFGALAMSKGTLKAIVILVAISVGFVSGHFVSQLSEPASATNSRGNSSASSENGAGLSEEELLRLRSERDALKEKTASLTKSNRKLREHMEQHEEEDSETDPDSGVEIAKNGALDPRERIDQHFKELGRRLAGVVDSNPDERNERMKEVLREL